MRGLRGCWVWMLATALSAAATPPEPVAGPWVLLQQDGGVRIGLEFAASADAARLAACTVWRDGAACAADASVADLDRGHGAAPTRVVAWRLRARAWSAGGFALHDGVRVLGVGRLPTLPTLASAARVAVAGGANWPDADLVERLGATLGGAVQLVVGLGDGLERDLGRGGWEAFTPVVAVGVPARGPAAVLLGGADGDWADGVRWGVLGLPSARTATAQATALARDLSPWQAFLEPRASWDPGLAGDAARADPAALAAMLALTGRLGVPLVLAAGSGAGAISEPLAVDALGRVVPSAKGTRYLLCDVGGDGLAALPPAAAFPLDARALVGLAADADRLLLAVEPAEGGRERHRLWWRAGADGAARETGDGVDVARVADRFHAGDAEATAILSWLPLAALTPLAPTPEEILALLAAADRDAGAARLLRRLAAIDASFLNGTARAVPDLPDWLARDLALRQLAGGGALDQGPVAALATVTTDHALLRALLVGNQRAVDRGAGLAPILARLRKQAAGELALDADPLLQHAFVSAAFDAPYLSPTPLRPLALALRGRLDAGARGPVTRFLARNGEERPVDR